jgi:nucleoside-diphosphate-sugar epimerase
LYGVTKVAAERLGVYYQQQFGLDFRAIRLPVIVAAHGSGGGASAYCSAVFEECVRKGRYDFYVQPTTRAQILYIQDAVRGLMDLHDAAPTQLSRCVYNIAGVSALAEELAAVVLRQISKAEISYRPDPLRSGIVESWPQQIDDSDAKRDWDWRVRWDLDRMAREIIEVLQDELPRK